MTEHQDPGRICRTCNGAGELVECRSPGSCSHVNDRTWPCTDCRGEGVIPKPVTA